MTEPENDAPEHETQPDAAPESAPAPDDSPEEAAPDDAEASEAKPKKEKPAWPPPPPERLDGAVEAILLVAGDVVRFGRLRDLLGLQSVLPVREAVGRVQEKWQAAGLAMELEEVGGGVRVVTRPEYAEYVGRLLKRPVSDKLSRTQLETLCIVAYKQPVGRAEVERIRGVQAGRAPPGAPRAAPAEGRGSQRPARPAAALRNDPGVPQSLRPQGREGPAERQRPPAPLARLRRGSLLFLRRVRARNRVLDVHPARLRPGSSPERRLAAPSARSRRRVVPLAPEAAVLPDSGRRGNPAPGTPFLPLSPPLAPRGGPVSSAASAPNSCTREANPNGQQ